jgi:hypothetical protein
MQTTYRTAIDLLAQLLTDEALGIYDTPTHDDYEFSSLPRIKKIAKLNEFIIGCNNYSPFRNCKVSIRYYNYDDIVIDCDTARGTETIARLKRPEICSFVIY